MDELEARQIMNEHRVERDVTDSRSCVDIVNTLKLVPRPEEITQTGQKIINAQAINMTANVANDTLPYFS